MTQATGVFVPDYDVRFDGAPAPLGLQADLRSIRVVEDVASLSMFELELENWDQDKLAVSWSDHRVVQVGTEVQISLGTVDDVEKVMLGEITELEPSWDTGATPKLLVRGHDHGHRLDRRRRSTVHARMKDSAIAAQLARENGFRADVADSKITLETVTQAHETDLEFLRRRAQRNGYEVFVRDRTLHFHPPRYTGQVVRRLDVAELDSFTVRLSVLDRVGQRTISGWDPKTKTVVTGRSAPALGLMGGRREGGKLADKQFGKGLDGDLDLTVSSAAEASQVARGRYEADVLTFVEGEAVASGLPFLRAGATVEITGAGTTFSGDYYVRTVRHTLDQDSGYRTAFDVRRTAA